MFIAFKVLSFFLIVFIFFPSFLLLILPFSFRQLQLSQLVENAFEIKPFAIALVFSFLTWIAYLESILLNLCHYPPHHLLHKNLAFLNDTISFLSIFN